MELNEISKRARPFSSPFRVDSGRGFRLTGTRRFSDLARHPDNERIGGILAFRVESSLMYFNVENVLPMVRERLRGEGPGVRLVICDLSASPYVDLAGAHAARSRSGAGEGRRRVAHHRALDVDSLDAKERSLRPRRVLGRGAPWRVHELARDA